VAFGARFLGDDQEKSRKLGELHCDFKSSEHEEDIGKREGEVPPIG
jgi:hypothetical protein